MKKPNRVMVDISQSLNKIQHQLESTTKAYNSSNDKEKAPPIIRAELHTPQAVLDRAEARDTRQERRDKIRVVIEGFALAAAVIYAGIAAAQWYQMKKATNVAQQGVFDADMNFRRDQRAWIQITVGTAKIVVAAPLEVSIHQVNIGRTAAKKVITKVIVELVRNGNDPAFGQRHPVTNYITAVLYPNTPGDFVAKLHSPNDTSATSPVIPLSRNDLDDFINGRVYLAIYGRVEFTDIFNTDHWVNFCSWQSGSANDILNYTAAKCTAYNDLDSN